MKLAIAFSLLAASCFAQSQAIAPPRVMVQYVTRRAPGMDQFGPAFSPYIFATAWAENSSIDGYVFTISYSTPSESSIVKTVVQSAVVQTVAAAVCVMSGEVVPGSIKVTVQAFSARQDIPAGVAPQVP
jgi:hypothetical protein